ncbi:hypothetical protein BVG16_01555 [Paenibacillus selenitireducens]|uniref:DNA-binding response regulator n=1 Tax=Paenibacillus selenitireducens TaxID=1324314 RepID=A0A1T2XMG3_9BACL|nr:response regulator [Paenibacillus selenitireducens]OPA81057.1 hypothetical protein BVG16_01555 [Paenibacillus selenitireducens]
MKLLIVDDEVIIRTGISQVIDWHGLGIQVLPPAASAEEALERLPIEQPQLVLTDIRMAGMNGLELAAHLRTHYPDIEVVILSGYDEFSYAQQALREGVSDYLLKTSRPEEIIKTMVKAQQRIQDRWAEEKRESRHHQAYRTQLLEQLITEGVVSEDMRLSAQEHFDLVPPPFAYQVMLITASGWDESALLLFAIENMMCESFSCETILRPDSLLILLRFDHRPMDPSSDIARIITRIEALLKCSIFAALGAYVSSYTGWKDSYREAEHTLAYRYISGGQETLSYEHIQHRKGGRSVCSREEEAALSSILVKGNRAELHVWIRDRIAEQIQDDQATPASLLAYLQSVLISGYRWLERVNPVACKEDNPLDGNPQETIQLNDHPEEALYRTCCSIMDTYRESSVEHRGNSYIGRAMVYIREHLHTSITLQQVARQVHLNPNHFSEVFKRETGLNYIEFITRERMNRAMEILAESETKISQVAKAVGYEDMKYFSQLFKKHTGRTPSEYRERN